MGNAGQGITQDATLTQNDPEEFADPIIDMIGAILRSGFEQHGDQPACAGAEKN